MNKKIIKTAISIAIICTICGTSFAQKTPSLELPNEKSIRTSTEHITLVRLYEAEHRLKEFTQIFIQNNPLKQEHNLNRIEAQMNYIRAILNVHTNSNAIMHKGLDVLEKYQILLSQINYRNEKNNLNNRKETNEQKW